MKIGNIFSKYTSPEKVRPLESNRTWRLELLLDLFDHMIYVFDGGSVFPPTTIWNMLLCNEAPFKEQN